jgi:glycosyl hydrolase family 123
MCSLLLVCVNFLCLTQGGQLALFDELEPLYPDTPVSEGLAQIQSHVPRGSIAGVHILWTGARANAQIEWQPGPGLSALPFRWYRLIDVPVEENTGLGSRTEQFEGKVNPYVIRRAPFRIFEAMQPIDVLANESSADTLALRLECALPDDFPPGNYTVKLSVKGAAPSAGLIWSIRVYPTGLPPLGAQTLRYTNWFSPDEMASRHGVEVWSAEFWPVLQKYAELMARGRQNTFWVRWPDMFAKGLDGELPKLRRKRLKKYIEIFRKAGLWWIEGAPIAHRPQGDWSQSWLELNVVGLPAQRPDGRAALKDMASQVYSFLLANDWQNDWVQHIADEPTDVNAGAYRELAGQLRAAMPGVPIVEATMTRELAGAIDIWCPQVQKFQAHREFFEQRQKAGDQVWIYTCLVPGGPWLNRLLDQQRLRQVYFGWMAAKYNLQGYLHWGLNHYKADPFAQSVVDHPAQPKTKNKLPAGDTHVIYPGPTEPWSSQRFEAHRIGMEDHALLQLLRAKNPDLAQEIIQSVFRTAEDYSIDVASYHAARQRLLVALQAPR